MVKLPVNTLDILFLFRALADRQHLAKLKLKMHASTATTAISDRPGLYTAQVSSLNKPQLKRSQNPCPLGLDSY